MIAVAFDTNVIAYAEGLNDVARQQRAVDVLQGLRHHALALPVQVAAEFHRLLMRRRGIGADQAAEVVRRWQGKLAIHPPTTEITLATAFHLATDHGFQIFDAVILAASAEAGCRLLLSEDMHDGFVWRGVTVANPFAATPHPLLADALRP